MDGPPARVEARRDYAFAGERLVGTEDPQNPGTSRMYATVDHLGTPRLWTDSSGQVLRKLKYYPFGKEATPSDQGPIALQFTGHERDANDLTQAGEDIDYMHARNELPGVGRFLSIDPIPGHPRRPQSWNQYAYVQGSPTNYTDPHGLLLKALTEAVRKDMCELVGSDCAKYLHFAEDGTVTVTATRDELAANESLNLFNDMASSSQVYGATIGDSLPVLGGALALGGAKGEFLAMNVSSTNDARPGNQPIPPAGFAGVSGVFSGLEAVARGDDGRPAHRASALFHELAENYQRTEKMQQYLQSHQGAIEREILLRAQRPELSKFVLGAGVYRRVNPN